MFQQQNQTIQKISTKTIIFWKQKMPNFSNVLIFGQQ